MTPSPHDPHSLHKLLDGLSSTLGRIAPPLDIKRVRWRPKMSCSAPSSPSVPPPSLAASDCLTNPALTTASTPTFTTHRVRVLTKEGWNRYDYSDVPCCNAESVPTIEISPPPHAPALAPPPPPLPLRCQSGANYYYYHHHHCNPTPSTHTHNGRRRTVSMDTKNPLRALPPSRAPHPPPTVADEVAAIVEAEAEIAVARHTLACAADGPPQSPPLSSPASISQPESFPQPESFSQPDPFSLPGSPSPPGPPSPPEFFSLPEPKEKDLFVTWPWMPPSPPRTPGCSSFPSLDSLSWLSEELALADSDYGNQGGEEKVPEVPPPEPRRPFLEFSPPSSPFCCSFPGSPSPPPSPSAANNQEPLDSCTSPRTKSPRSLATLPPKILLRIYRHLSRQSDMVALALASSALHAVFAAHATAILTAPLSPALADLLAPMAGPPCAHYAATIRSCTVAAQTLKRLIRHRCRYFLSKHLLAPRTAAQEQAFDDAIYNVWSFSARFACSPAATDAQVAWLQAPCRRRSSRFPPCTLPPGACGLSLRGHLNGTSRYADHKFRDVDRTHFDSALGSMLTRCRRNNISRWNEDVGSK